MSRLRDSDHARWLEAEGDRLLDFSRAARHPAGGFAWLDVAGRPELDRPVELWITCRMTHVFALGHLLGRPGCAALADHGLRSLEGRFRDATYGGWYAAVDGDGPTGRAKSAYPHAFVVLAAASASLAGRPGGRELLDEALDVLLTRFWDDEHGMVVEEFDESFTQLDAYRGVNANMHTVEALLEAADATGDRTLARPGAADPHAGRPRARAAARLAAAGALRRGVDPAAGLQRRPAGATRSGRTARPSVTGSSGPGWRCTCGPRSVRTAPDWLLDDAVSLFEASIREGWAVDGADGFVYTVDWEGRPVVRERMHWVAAEAIATAAALHAATGDPAYDGWYATWWDHVSAVFLDHQLGSWRHELDPANRPSHTVWTGKPDTYHAFQATLFPRLPLTPTLPAALRDGLLG